MQYMGKSKYSNRKLYDQTTSKRQEQKNSSFSLGVCLVFDKPEDYLI